MTDEQRGPCGPDLTQGVSLADLPDRGKLVGHVGDETVLLARSPDVEIGAGWDACLVCATSRAGLDQDIDRARPSQTGLLRGTTLGLCDLNGVTLGELYDG